MTLLMLLVIAIAAAVALILNLPALRGSGEYNEMGDCEMTGLTVEKVDSLPCGHHKSLAINSAETGEFLYCDLCDCRSARNDAERMETELRAELAALSDRGGEAVAIVGENQVLEWAPPYIRPPVGTKLYTRPQVGHLAPDSDPSSHRRCKCEFSGGGVLAKTCDFHRRLLAAQVSENAAQEGASSQLSNNGSSRRLGAETSEDAPPAAAPPAAGEVQELADRLEQYIPDGDGYNGEYAKTLTAAVAFLRGTSHE